MAILTNTKSDDKAINLCRKERGFTLIEMMIVVAIISILATIAVPSYQKSITKGRRNDAQWALTAFASAMERHFTANNTYEGAAAGGGNTGTPAIFATETPLNGADKFYDLTIQAASATAYTLRATPKNAQAGDGLMELTNTGIRRWDENSDGNTGGAGEDNWKQG